MNNNVISLAEEGLKRGIKRYQTLEILRDLEKEEYSDVNLYDNKIIPTRDEEGIWEDDGGLPPHNED